MTFEKFTGIQIGPLDIQIWGLMVAVGMLIALILSLRSGKKRKLKGEIFIDIFILVFIAGLIGSYLFFVLERFNEFYADPSKLMQIQHIGLSLMGGFLFGALALLIYSKVKKINFWQLTDHIAPGVAIGLGIARIGSYLMGDHIGSRTKFFLGSYYHGDLRHEPSLYLSINALVLFLFLWLISPFVKRKEGAMSFIFIVWYSLSRFLLDFTRASDIIGMSDPRFFYLTLTQWVCLVLLIIFVPQLVLKLKK